MRTKTELVYERRLLLVFYHGIVSFFIFQTPAIQKPYSPPDKSVGDDTLFGQRYQCPNYTTIGPHKDG